MNTIIESIKENQITAIIRGAKADSIEGIAAALYEGGVKTLEITMETPSVLKVIETLRIKYEDELTIGAGTVLDAETARAAIMSGAQFIFSPTVNTETIKMTKRYGVISIPGALTPSEIITAYENGADIIKVFPADSMGPEYLKNIAGPFPYIPLMPTGGITLDNIKTYKDYGAVAFGVGSALVDSKKHWTEDESTKLTKRAKAFKKAVDG